LPVNDCIARSKSETSFKLLDLEKLTKPFDIQATPNLKTRNDDFKSNL
jgi:hypothetical protein